ncbi:MAG: hypothetical protein ACJ8BF_13865 [Gemmatimonadales bacterium]
MTLLALSHLASGSLGVQTAACMMWEIARGLEHDDPEGRKRWIEQRVIDALMILVQDGEAAWNRIRSELEQRGYLSGDEVRALIAESDAEVARRPPSGTEAGSPTSNSESI